MSVKKFAFTVALLVAIGVAVPSLLAQSVLQGDLTGTVTDPSGAVIPNAQVTLNNNDTGTTVTRQTTGTGAYRFALLSPGNYTVTISAPNYQTVKRSVRVAVGQATTVNVQMALATEQQTVTVTAEGSVLQTETSNLSTTMSTEQVQLVPNGGGDLSYVAQTAPGAAMNTQGGYGNLAMFGISGISNNFTYNGMAENDPFLNLNNSGATNILLGQNDVNEATVVNNGYSGQYSQAGANVNYVSRSGTNDFHGNAIYYWNGRVMNANNYFNKQNGAPRGFVNDNQWAASFGGPIKKNNTFFFVDTEGLRVIVPVTRQVNVPTVAFQNAVLANIGAVQPGSTAFYQNMFHIWNNAPGANRAANVLRNGGCREFAAPATATTPAGPGVALGFGTSQPCAVQYNSTVNDLTSEWLITGRVDHNFGANDRMFVHFRSDQGNQATYTDPLDSRFNVSSKQPQYEGQLQETHAFGSNTVNSFSLNGSYYRAIFAHPNIANTLALQPVELAFSGSALRALGANYTIFPQGRNATQYGFVDDFSHTMGNHNLKFGASFARYDITDYDPGIGSLPAVTGETLTSFFNGVGANFNQSFPVRATQPVALYRLGFYGSDEWRVTQNLKLTLTVRADRNSNPACRTNCFNRLTSDFLSLNHDSNLPYNQSILTGQELAFPSSYHPWEIQPRFGFNWSPFGTGTVISGGFGVFSDVFPAGFVDGLMNNLPGDPAFLISGQPFTPGLSGNAQSQALAAANALRAGFANGATFGSLSAALPSFSAPNFFNVANGISAPRYQEWDLQVQQGLGQKTALVLKYVGNHGIHEQINNNSLNAFCNSVAAPGATSCLAQLGLANSASFAGIPTTQIDPRFLQITEVSSGYRSNYNGLTASLIRRLSAFQFQINYTWSHALDYVSNNGVTAEPFNNNTNLSITNPLNPSNPFANMYGNADYDVRHYLSMNYVWNTPRSWFHGVLGGWTVAGTIFARTGLPYTVIDSGTGSILNGFGYGGTNTNVGTFGDQLGGFGQSLSCGAHFAKPEAGQCPIMQNDFTTIANGFGNQRRNQLYGPRFFNTDLTVMKKFPIPHWESAQLAVGAIFYNLLNHPNFDQPQADLANSSYGTIQSTVNPPTSIYGAFLGADASPRNIQLTARITF